MSTKKSQDLPTIALKAVGLDPQKFAPEKLGISYQMFRYRMRKESLRLSDYHAIMLYTGCSFEQLWPSPLVPGQPKPITLNLSESRLSPVKELKKPEPANGPPASAPFKFEIENVYDGGLPTDESGGNVAV